MFWAVPPASTALEQATDLAYTSENAQWQLAMGGSISMVNPLVKVTGAGMKVPAGLGECLKSSERLGAEGRCIKAN